MVRTLCVYSMLDMNIYAPTAATPRPIAPHQALQAGLRIGIRREHERQHRYASGLTGRGQATACCRGIPGRSAQRRPERMPSSLSIKYCHNEGWSSRPSDHLTASWQNTVPPLKASGCWQKRRWHTKA